MMHEVLKCLVDEAGEDGVKLGVQLKSGPFVAGLVWESEHSGVYKALAPVLDPRTQRQTGEVWYYFEPSDVATLQVPAEKPQVEAVENKIVTP